jgi:hypothetical protein
LLLELGTAAATCVARVALRSDVTRVTFGPLDSLQTLIALLTFRAWHGGIGASRPSVAGVAFRPLIARITLRADVTFGAGHG